MGAPCGPRARTRGACDGGGPPWARRFGPALAQRIGSASAGRRACGAGGAGTCRPATACDCFGHHHPHAGGWAPVLPGRRHIRTAGGARRHRVRTHLRPAPGPCGPAAGRGCRRNDGGRGGCGGRHRGGGGRAGRLRVRPTGHGGGHRRIRTDPLRRRGIAARARAGRACCSGGEQSRQPRCRRGRHRGGDPHGCRNRRRQHPHDGGHHAEDRAQHA